MPESESPGERPRPYGRWVFASLVALLISALLWTSRRGSERLEPAVVPRPPAASSPYKNARPGVAYVGDEACARCHQEIARSFRTHPMGRSMAPAAEVMPEVSGVVAEVGDLAYSIERREGRVFHQEARKDASGRVVARTEAEARYALGSGTRGIAFLVEREGRLYQSPIAWYAQKPGWDLAPSYRQRNLHFDRPIVLECLFCHTNRVESVDEGPPVFRGLAIGCERCHGPGELHARKPEAVDGRDLTIVNPAHLEPPALRESVCEQCHLQGTQRSSVDDHSPFDYRPGLDLSEFIRVWSLRADPTLRRNAVGQVEQMHESRCYQGSGGRLGCISCHDPHRLPGSAERVAYYRGRCLECHDDRGCRLPAESRRLRSPDDDCAACHMPRSGASDIAHTSVTHHGILRHGAEP